MGKSSRIKSAKQEIAELKRQEAERIAAQNKKKTITAIIISAVCIVLVAAFVLTLVLMNYGKKQGNHLRSEIVLKTDNFEINGATFTYFVNYEYQNFVSTYASNLESYGLDVSVPLRDQETSDGQNWFDYIVSRAQSSLEELMLLAEKAKAEGYVLGDKENKEIESFFADMQKEAEENKMSFDEYVTLLYGEGVKKADIEDGIKISMLATKYYNETIELKERTDDEINKYYADNNKSFETVDYKYYTFKPLSGTDVSDEDASASQTAAKANADKLAKAKTPTEFDSILTAILKADGMSDTDIKDAIDASVAEGSTYDDQFSISVWAFSGKAKLNETKTYQNGNSHSVYMITSLPKRDESETRSVRHILISSESEDTDSEAKKKAEDILAEYNKGEKTSESFTALAEKYTEDTGSKSTGGLYENFPKGQMVAEFENWAFDAKRQNGDVEIVKTSYGYHIMFFEKKGEPAWKSVVVSAMKDNEYTVLFEELEEKYTVDFSDKILDEIPVITFRNGTSSAAE